QSLGSAVVLNVLLWLGLLVSIPRRGFNPLYGTAAIVGAVLIAAFALAVVSLTRGEERTARIVCRVANRLPFVDGDTLAGVLGRVAERLRVLGADRRLLARAGLWATANWLLDAASLWVFVAAFGHRVDVDALIVAFGLANVLAAIPLTPGGLGVVEAVLTSALVGFGTPRRTAVLGVLLYRLVNFWLPIPIGGLAYLSLKVGPASTREERKAALRRAAEESIAEAEDPRTWAEDRGIRLPGGE
ncbi:MAG TPA: YbhN family protein, partial [Acidimicrobiales bacterium]